MIKAAEGRSIDGLMLASASLDLIQLSHHFEWGSLMGFRKAASAVIVHFRVPVPREKKNKSQPQTARQLQEV